MAMTSRSKQTLGQVAYEGWLGEGIGGPAWAEVAHDPHDGPAWQAAAEAVARECWDRGVVLPEVSAVIEAAKARTKLREHCRVTDSWDTYEDDLWELDDEVDRAVLALQEE